jgi:hypothetical protein
MLRWAAASASAQEANEDTPRIGNAGVGDWLQFSSQGGCLRGAPCSHHGHALVLLAFLCCDGRHRRRGAGGEGVGNIGAGGWPQFSSQSVFETPPPHPACLGSRSHLVSSYLCVAMGGIGVARRRAEGVGNQCRRRGRLAAFPSQSASETPPALPWMGTHLFFSHLYVAMGGGISAAARRRRRVGNAGAWAAGRSSRRGVPPGRRLPCFDGGRCCQQRPLYP